ncbi:MAG: hypothetical protein AAF871_17450, partial [Pseudomonadota bacterium]
LRGLTRVFVRISPLAPVVRKSLIQMIFVLALLALMAIWQAEFIINAITANVFLNSCIIGTFSFGVYTAFSRVIALRNDFVAFNSMKEDYDDAIRGELHGEEDPTWRYYRCKEDAKVFVMPRILERPYTILAEEIAANSSLSISTGSMQNLLDNVDEQLDEGRSLIAYVTGLLVFLGLIGTFIGLMVTLGSVGDIIGGLDLSGGAGAEAIQKLMDDLQIPLKGMATGFSSSLFGLITSLVLGLVALFGNKAAGKLKDEFGTWLAGVSKVGDGREAGRAGGEGGSGRFLVENERMLSIMYRTAKMSLVSNARVVATVEGAAETSKVLLRAMAETQEGLAALTGAIGNLLDGAKVTNATLAHMAGLMESREELREEVARLQTSGDANARNITRVAKALHTLAERHAVLQSEAKRLGQTFANRDDLDRLSEATKTYLERGFSGVYGAVVELSDTLVEIEDGLKTRGAARDVTLRNLGEMSRRLREDLHVAIAESQEALAVAQAAAEEEDAPDAFEQKLEEANREARNGRRSFLDRMRRKA